MTEEQVRVLLQRRVEEAEGPVAYGRRHAVSAAYVGDAMAGRRSPGPAILLALGLTKHVEKSISYEEAVRD